MRSSTVLRSNALALCVAVTGCLTGCGAGPLAFHNDHRLSFHTPAARSQVQSPLTIRWSMTDFHLTGLDGSTTPARGAFAVFVDRAPMPVGSDLRWFAAHDAGCLRDPRCPDPTYLATRGVHITTDTSLELEVLPPVAAGVGDEQHSVTVVLLNGAGQRFAESAWYLPFTSRHRGSA